jgi:hypothetical protein
MKRILSLAAIFAAVACGGGDTGPTTANITGSWTYAVTNLTAGAFMCNTSGTTLTLNETAGTFSGFHSGGILTCSQPGIPTQSAPIVSGAIVTGVVTGRNLSFNLDNSDWTNTGTIAGNSMSGTAQVVLFNGTTRVTLTGKFVAARN